ncbi:arsinothricin resistance N-acetyltransferase ArsN1 family B [Pleionea mediterranea]|uniref:Phosphinothricin acetyltransferase n=1 Tax=Pleionea mediterranea TaxID=523701 RepID=A0A316FVC1_9GAMM|nr:arsinothricin resistance N-acetyltransferase ArsN1 family B [Pleionea mediterranea]PWK45351.1 phosphinothricin acetyltransferase [Pleionea mediterranea]
MIRAAQPDDAESIANIYNHYIANTLVTFEEEPVSGAEMLSRIEDVTQQSLPWFVYVHNNDISGFAYASKWKGRCAYRYSVEVTVYLSPNVIGKGLGTQLYQALFEQLKQQSFHTVIAGISLPNEASVALHKKFGMKQVALFEQVGYKFDRWVDVGYWQKVL